MPRLCNKCKAFIPYKSEYTDSLFVDSLKWQKGMMHFKVTDTELGNQSKMWLLTGTSRYSPSEGLHASDFFFKLLPLSSLNTEFQNAIYYEKKAGIDENNSSVSVHINNKTRYLRLLKHASFMETAKLKFSKIPSSIVALKVLGNLHWEVSEFNCSQQNHRLQQPDLC